MASKKLFHANYIFVNPETDFNPSSHHHHHHNLFEFDESDVWNINNNNNSQFETKKMVPTSRLSKKGGCGGGGRNIISRPPAVTCSGSLPVNIPDWSKIYREDHKFNNQVHDQDYNQDQESDDNDEDGRIPPHEYLARRRGASFSVHEGIGRTLKGRDLRQVRNAIWKKVGFED